MHSSPLEAYSNVQKATMNGSEIEAFILNDAALKLKHCQDNWEDNKGFNEKLNKALKFNQQIWNFFQSEMINPYNSLPEKFKKDILSLSLFINKRIFEIMAYPAPEKLEAIININLNLAEGLKSPQMR